MNACESRPLKSVAVFDQYVLAEGPVQQKSQTPSHG
jgi:hypothetical protein